MRFYPISRCKPVALRAAAAGTHSASRPWLVVLALAALAVFSPVRAKAQSTVAPETPTISVKDKGHKTMPVPKPVETPSTRQAEIGGPSPFQPAAPSTTSSPSTAQPKAPSPLDPPQGMTYEEPGPGVPHAFVVLSPVTIAPERDPVAEVHYRRTKYHVRKVYPYALEALQQLAELDSVSAQASKKREVRRYRKDIQKELEDRFKDDLKQLSRTQGRILLDMLERQTGEAFYYTLKDIKSGTTAFFWQALAKRFDYDLKEGYSPGADPTLEALLEELEWPPLAYRNPATVP